MKKDLIRHCYKEHIKDLEGCKFSFYQYVKYWLIHERNKNFSIVNRDKSEVKCKSVYFPLPYYKELRALVDCGNNDLREVPVYFLLIQSLTN